MRLSKPAETLAGLAGDADGFLVPGTGFLLRSGNFTPVLADGCRPRFIDADDGVLAQPHAGVFARVGPLSEPQVGPERLKLVALERHRAQQSAKLHQAVLTAGISGPVMPVQGMPCHGYRVGCPGQRGKIGFQRRVGVKRGEQGNSPQYRGKQGLERKRLRRDKMLAGFDAQGCEQPDRHSRGTIRPGEAFCRMNPECSARLVD